MQARDFDPVRLDVKAFAKEAGRLEGRWPLIEFGRLADVVVPAERCPIDADEVIWSVRGELRSVRAGEAQHWLHLTAHTRLALECQRCLNAVEVALQVERSILFVVGEDAAERIDADREDDVLALTRALDLRQLVEDELLLAMPLVPRHDSCPEPLLLPVPGADKQAVQAAPNPFAALATLRRGGPVN